MKKIPSLLLLTIMVLSYNAIEARTHNDKPINTKELKKSRKQESINAIYELLKSHTFSITEFSRSMREQFFRDETVIYCDKLNPANTKVVYETFDEKTKTYKLVVFYDSLYLIRNPNAYNCQFTFNLKSGILEVRSFHTPEKRFITQQEVEQQRGIRLFVGDYSNVVPLNKLQGW